MREGTGYMSRHVARRASGPAHQVLLELVLPKRSKGTTMGMHCFGDSFSCLPTCRKQRVSLVYVAENITARVVFKHAQGPPHSF